MPRMILHRSIDAPVDLVFKTIADISEFSQAIPHIVKVEFLTDVTSGIGLDFVRRD